jgi:hypothetical protein
MKAHSSRNVPGAFTLVELFLLTAVIAILALMLLPPPHHHQPHGMPFMNCMNNLKQIGAAAADMGLG